MPLRRSELETLAVLQALALVRGMSDMEIETLRAFRLGHLRPENGDFRPQIIRTVESEATLEALVDAVMESEQSQRDRIASVLGLHTRPMFPEPRRPEVAPTPPPSPEKSVWAHLAEDDEDEAV